MRKTSAAIRFFPKTWPLPVPLLMSGTAILLGLMTAIGVWLFKQAIALAQWSTQASIRSLLGWWTALVLPVLGGFFVGLASHFLLGEERYPGVAGIIEAVALAGGRLRYWRSPVKALLAALSIGTGASVGPEDPSVQIGAGIGSMLGQRMHFPDERVQAMVGAGAAAGIAAAFNAPIAGVFFALEIILGEISSNALGLILLAAVASAILTQAISGPQPAFTIPAYSFHSAVELLFYFGLGLLTGLLSAAYIYFLSTARDRFAQWPAPRWLKPAVAGLGVGAVGLFLPQVMGIGYPTVEKVLLGERMSLMLLVALLGAKLVLTPLSIGGGFMGGVFAPALFLGAMAGGAYGTLCRDLFPGLGLIPSAFALVGMAALLGGAIRAPLTATMLAFEMTGDYRIILPLMFAVPISMLLSQRLQRDSVYTVELTRRGIRIERGRDVEVLSMLTVGEVMQRDVEPLRETDPLQAALERMARLRTHGLPVVNADGDLCGILTLEDVETAHARGLPAQTVGDICTRQLVVAYPDETLDVALRRMSERDLGRLPVVDRQNPRRLVGFLQRVDVTRAYHIAVARRTALRHRAQEVRLGILSGAHVEEIRVEPDSPCAKRPVREIHWPRDCLIAAIRRGNRVLIPRGDTVILPGDVLTVVTESGSAEILRTLCTSRPQPKTEAEK
ncbi:chloride channel protein [Thermoflexus sp.]|uniref:chloride channel protein n=1 Tax=Thermoflexus sp. TaxID=1969742 RepID=UPI0035E41E66